MTTHSDAAKKYAFDLARKARLDHMLGCICVTCEDECLAFDAGAAYDAPPLAAWERELLGADPEPVRCCDLVGEPFDHAIDSGWLCEVHTHHTCGSTDPHEPGCGLVPLVNLAELKGWPATTEPVLLTADDPRIKVGALVEITSTKGKREGASVTYRNFVTDTPRSAWCVDEIRDEITKGATFVLLAEAPDPDVDVLDAMEQTEGTKSDEALAHLRSLGHDVVKRAVS